MPYCLLTGPTGLLGSYLLRDALDAGRHMAVLVRPSRWESVRSRVESMLARLEKTSGRILPRPVVIEGDLSQPGLAIQPDDLRWIARHCNVVLHNAANLTLDGDCPGEPWLSNLEGTREMLEVCRATGIRRFHHVSTAYVCGQREGRILETELDQGQPFNNDYEQSKAQAEKFLRSAAHLDSLTVYRPSIIVGDSQTGFTSAYHGVYLALKLAHTLASRVSLGSTAGASLLQLWSMRGSECKNLVPVDWVSAAITALVGQPRCHGTTYHITTRHPLTLARIARVFQEAVERYSALADESDAGRLDGHWFESNFREQMATYQAYLRHDPVFDDAHTAAALPQLPCPKLDDSALLRMAEFAIKANFGKPKPRAIHPEFDVAKHLEKLLRHRHATMHRSASEHSLGLQVDGPGGGQWRLILEHGHLVAAEQGLSPRCSATYRLDCATFRQMALGQLPVGHALVGGHVAIHGNGLSMSQFAAVMESVVIGTPMPTRAAG